MNRSSPDRCGIARAIALSACAATVGCSSSTSGDFREIGQSHASNMHSLYPDVTHFVVAPESAMRDRAAVLAYAREKCAGEEQVCFVLFWTDASKAASRYTITDSQADAMVASYDRNRSTGKDGFQCYNFGSSSERCSRR